MGYRIEPDGTRVYDKGYRYQPKTGKKYRKVQPDETRFHGVFYGPLDVLPMSARTMPWTRPDEEAVGHPLGCICRMCKTVPRVRRLRQKRFRPS